MLANIFKSNRDLDTTLFLIGFLVLTGKFMVLCHVSPEFAKLDISQRFMEMLGNIWIFIAGYLFSKIKAGNGNGQQQQQTGG